MLNDKPAALQVVLITEVVQSFNNNNTKLLFAMCMHIFFKL